MNLHCFQHVPFEGLGSIEPWARAAGHRLTTTRCYAGDSLPHLGQFDGLIVMGGPMSVHDEAQYPWLAGEKRLIGQAINSGKIVLGICLGAQLIAAVLGARVYRNRQKEIGWFPVWKTAEAGSAAMAGALPSRMEGFHWHGETFDRPPGTIHLARSEACENQAFAYGARVLALQFHLETTLESARTLIEHCGDELVAGPTIQTAGQMLGDAGRFRGINETMCRLLDTVVLKPR